MKTWMRFGIGAAALIVAIAIGTAASAVWVGGDEAPAPVSDDGGSAESACLVGTVDCDDTPGEGLNQSCLVGTPDCVDADLGGDAANCAKDVVECRDTGGGAASMCIEGATDCVDTPYGDFGEIPARCMPEAVECNDMQCAPDACYSYEVCTTEPAAPEPGAPVLPAEQAIDSVTTCTGVACAPPPAPDPLVDPPVAPEPEVGAPEPQIDPAVDVAPATQAGDPDTSGCLGIDPCTISSQQMCPPPDCAVSSDGTTTCYAFDSICAAPEDASESVVSEAVQCDDMVAPSEGQGSSGSGGTEPGAVEPQPAP